jgi:hypothetical protein
LATKEHDDDNNDEGTSMMTGKTAMVETATTTATATATATAMAMVMAMFLPPPPTATKSMTTTAAFEDGNRTTAIGQQRWDNNDVR